MRGRAPNVPTGAYLAGAFVLDFFWIGFGVGGIDPSPWSDWSHSLVMAAIWATVFGVMFFRFGRAALCSVWLIVFSHFVLDLMTQGATLYPFAPVAPQIPILFTTHALLAQRMLVALFLAVFVRDEWRAGSPTWRTLAACALVVGLSFR